MEFDDYFAGHRVTVPHGLIVEMFPATQFVDLGNDVLLRLNG